MFFITMACMKKPVAQLLLLLLPMACTSLPSPEPVRLVYFESPCVTVTWEGTPGSVNGVTLQPGPEEMEQLNPAGIYVADGDACRGELLVMPYTLKGEGGKAMAVYSVLAVQQPWFVGYARTQVTAPLRYHAGVLSRTAEPEDNFEPFREYGVLKTESRRILALVDREGEPYTRCEMKPVEKPSTMQWPGNYFQNRRKGAGEWDGLLLLKLDFGGEPSCKWFNLVCVEQSAPHAMPVVSVLQGLQRRGNKLTDASGMVHYIISKGALHTPSGRSFAEMELSPLIPVVRSANSP